MPLTLEDKAKILAPEGLKPWQADVIEHLDGGVEIVPTQTEAQDWPRVAGKEFLLQAPRTLASAAGSALASRFGMMASPVTAALGANAGPIGATLGAAAPPVIAGALGAGGANMLYDAADVQPRVEKMINYSPAQQARNAEEHPYVTTASRLATYLLANRFEPIKNVKDVAKAVPVITSAARNPEALAALGRVSGNLGFGVGAEGYRQLKAGEFDPAALAESAGLGLALGGFRKAFGGATPKRPSEVAKTTASPKQAPDVPIQEINYGDTPETRNAPMPPTGAIGGSDRGAGYKEPLALPERVPIELPAETPNLSLREWLKQREGKRPFPQAADAPSPEPAAVLDEAVRAAADPATTKKAAFIPAGSPEVEAQGLKPVTTPKGTILVNSAKVQPGEPLIAGDQIKGTALGLSQDVKPADARAAVVTDKPGAPAVLTELVDSPEAAQRAKEAQALAVRGGTQRVTSPEEVVQTRLDQRAKELINKHLGTGVDNANQVPSPVETIRGQAPRPAAQVAEGGAGEVRPPAEAGAGEVSAPQDLEYVRGSLLKKVADISPGAGRALANFFNTKDRIFGQWGNAPVHELARQDPQLVLDTWRKRWQAQITGQQPQYTPDEQHIAGYLEHLIEGTRQLANEHGFDINKIPNYVPELLSTHVIREAAGAGKNIWDWVAANRKPFDDINRVVYGASYDPADAGQWLRTYLEGAATAPNSLGSDFGALTKSARQYHLPAEWQEPDPVRAWERYTDRFSRQVAKRAEIEKNPEASAVFGYSKVADPETGAATAHPLTKEPAVDNGRRAIEGVLTNPSHGQWGLSQDTGDLLRAAQQTIYSGVMQTATGVKNTVQKIPMHAVLTGESPETLGALFRGTYKTLADYQAQLQKAMEMNVVRPGRDPTAVGDLNPQQRAAMFLKQQALHLRRLTLGDAIETFNRVHDYSVGEALAEVQMRRAQAGDEEGLQFMRRFGAGLKDGMSHEEALARVARNYTQALQGSYGPEGLPATMINNSPIAIATRIKRFGWENMNRMIDYTIKPAREGNFKPLMLYLLGAAATAPVIQQISQLFSGAPSGLPTDEEIKAGKKDPTLEHAFNLMSLAQTVGLFGEVGNDLGALAGNIRGGNQGIIGDPLLSATTTLVNNMTAAAEAVRRGEQAIPAIEQAVVNTILDNAQLLRRFKHEPGEAEDMRNRRVFEYLSEHRKNTIPGVVNSTLLGGVGPGYAPRISPLEDAAREGDKEARAKLDKEARARVDNYKGGFEDQRTEAQYRGWIKQTQGQEALDNYIKRRAAFVRKTHGVPEVEGQPR